MATLTFFDGVRQTFEASTLPDEGLTIWADEKPRDITLPSMIIKVPSGPIWTSDSTDIQYSIRPSFAILATTKAEASRLAELVIAAYTDKSYSYGPGERVKSYPLALSNKVSGKDQGETIGGVKCFRETIEWWTREIRPRP